MTIRDPDILSPQADTDSLERCVSGKTWIESRAWDDWECELVEYFLRHGYKGREIDDFIRSHALASTS